MTAVRVFLARVFGLLRRDRRDADLHDEIQTHLELLTEEQVRNGVPRAAARAAAERQFGAVQRVKEEYREQQGLHFVDSAAQDLRYALRQLRKHPGLVCAALVTLMLGIGANTAIFTVLNAMTVRSSPIPDADRLAIIWTTPPGRTDARQTSSTPEYYYWRDHNRTFDYVGTFLNWSSNLGSTVDGVPADRLSGGRYSRTLFQAIGVQPQLGRLFSDTEDAID
jgi:hypothetical protein